MPDQKLSNTSDAWIDAMRESDEALRAEAEADRRKRQRQGRGEEETLSVLGKATGRALGMLTHGGPGDHESKEDKRERAEIEKRTRPRDDKPKIATEDKLRLRATIGHVTFDETEVYAWYAITNVSNGFHPILSIEQAMAQDALAYAKLEGRRIKIRSTTRPYSVSQWAKDTYQDATAKGRVPIDAFGGPFLGRSQKHMQRLSFSEKWVYLGVRVSTFRQYSKDPLRELAKLRPIIDDITRELAVSSLRATPATNEDMEWLIRRSIALGVPMPRVGVAADYEHGDIPALDAAATWTGEALDKHISVTAQVPGAEDAITMKVAVLTLGRLSDQVIPQDQQTGWMQRTDRLGFPVEWMATIDVLSEAKTQSWIRSRMNIIRDQMKHYVEEHGIQPPTSLSRHMAVATDIQTQLDSDHGGAAIRTSGWYRVAVSAADDKTLKERVARLRKVYGSRAELIDTPNQYHTAREFIPGEKLSTGAHRRRMSVSALAAAIPQGTAEVGDKCGVVLGYTVGSAMRAVAWHPHWDMEQRDRSGLFLLAGGLGSGKTFALGGIVYQSVMMGVQWSVLDPSDRLGRLCDLPELKGRAKYTNLMKGRAGELSPYRCVAEPKREHFKSSLTDKKVQAQGDSEYEQAVSDARGVRLSLMSDVLYSFLKAETRAADETDSILTRALGAVEPVRSSSPAAILAAIEDMAEGRTELDLESRHRIKARDLLITYRRLASSPVGKLIFPPADAPPLPDFDDDDILLHVYTLNGIQIPDAKSIANDKIGDSARMSMSIMTLAAWLVQSRIYLGDRAKRKGLAIDEGKTITTIDAGKNLITKTATDSRKFNLRAILCSQNVTHFDLDSDSEDSLGNLVGAAMIGHTEDDNAVNAALKVLGAPLNEGYGAILKNLRPRQAREEVTHDFDGNLVRANVSDDAKRNFIFSDGRNIERIVVDLDAHPQLVAALNSRPLADEAPIDLTQFKDPIAQFGGEAA